MEKTCYLSTILWIILLTACTEKEPMFNQHPIWKVADANWCDGRAATRAVTDNVPTTELPQELIVKQVDSDPEITFTIEQEHSHDHDGYISYHTTITEDYDPEASFIAYNKDWPTEPYCGFFDYMSTEPTDFDSDKHLMFTLKHRSALIRLFFGISEKYNVTRQVKLTSVKCCGTEWQSDDILLPSITPESPLVVSDTWSLAAWYYVSPRAITALTLNVNYAVYSNNELGTDSRFTRQVEAEIPLNNLLDSEGTKLTQIEAGNYYDLYLLIDPDYLYTLSDHDERTGFDLILH